MLASFIALVLAGRGDLETVPDPDGTPMRVESATARTLHAGACPVAPAAPIPTQNAVIQIDYRVVARDDASYTVAVFLDTGDGQVPTRLGGTEKPSGLGFGFAAPVFTQTWTDGSNGFVNFEYVGYVEDGPKAATTVNWTFLVGLMPGANNQNFLGTASSTLTSVVRVPWAKKYGTCG